MFPDKMGRGEPLLVEIFFFACYIEASNMFAFLILFVIYLPFQLAINPQEGIDLASARIIILLLFFIWLAEGLRKKRLNVHLNKTTFFLCIFLFVSIFSFFWAKNQDWATRKILFLCSIFPLYFVASDVVENRERIIKVVKWLVFSGALIATLGIIQFFSQFIFSLEQTYGFWADYVAPPFLGKNVSLAVLENPSWLVDISGHTFLRATATFPDPHILSLYLGMLLPLAAGIFLKTKNKIYLLIFLLILASDVLTFSRGGYLGLLAGVFFLLAIVWKKIGKKSKYLIFGFITIVVVIFLVPGPISERFQSIFDLKEGSNVGRMDMWQKSWQVAESHPFLGVGIGNYPLEVKASADYREPITAHNTYLDVASETGVINAIFWILLLISAVLAFIKKSEKDNFYIMPATSVVIFSAHQIAETAIYSPVVLSLFVILISFANINDEKNN